MTDINIEPTAEDVDRADRAFRPRFNIGFHRTALAAALRADREHLASLQDPWVEVPEGHSIPAGVGARREFLHRQGAEEWVTELERTSASTRSRLYVHKSDFDKIIQPKTRHELIAEDMAAQVGTGLSPSAPAFIQLVGVAEEWARRYEAAVERVGAEA